MDEVDAEADDNNGGEAEVVEDESVDFVYAPLIFPVSNIRPADDDSAVVGGGFPDPPAPEPEPEPAVNPRCPTREIIASSRTPSAPFVPSSLPGARGGEAALAVSGRARCAAGARLVECLFALGGFVLALLELLGEKAEYVFSLLLLNLLILFKYLTEPEPAPDLAAYSDGVTVAAEDEVDDSE